MERREEARFHPTAQIEPPPCSSGTQESLPVLVLPLEQCLYSCSHVPRLFGASHPAAQSLLCALLAFVKGFISVVLFSERSSLISSSHAYFPRATSPDTFGRMLPTRLGSAATRNCARQLDRSDSSSGSNVSPASNRWRFQPGRTFHWIA